MIITLGRNKPNGNSTAVVESIENKVFLNLYKQKKGWSDFKILIESIELDDERVNSIVEYYKRLKT